MEKLKQEKPFYRIFSTLNFSVYKHCIRNFSRLPTRKDGFQNHDKVYIYAVKLSFNGISVRQTPRSLKCTPRIVPAVLHSLQLTLHNMDASLRRTHQELTPVFF